MAANQHKFSTSNIILTKGFKQKVMYTKIQKLKWIKEKSLKFQDVSVFVDLPFHIQLV